MQVSKLKQSMSWNWRDLRKEEDIGNKTSFIKQT